MLKKVFNIHLAAIILLPVLVHYIFGFTIISSAIALFAALFAYFSLKHKRDYIYMLLAALLAGIAYFVTWNNIADLNIIAAIIIGMNLAVLYFKSQNIETKHKGEINLLNIVLLASLVFSTAIQKFRGFNKIYIEDINLSVPIIILIVVALYFLVEAIQLIMRRLKMADISIKLGAFLALSAAGAYFAFSYFLFKEIGTERIFVPLAAGLAAGLIEKFVKPKTVLTEITEVLLLVILPFPTGGFLGALLAFLTANLFVSATKVESESGTLWKLFPIAFIFAAAEIRENEGVITRFNLVEGNMIGWIFIAILIIYYSVEFAPKLAQVFKENEIEFLFPLVTIVFAILGVTTIIRVGNDESLAALILASSVYLFFSNLGESKKVANSSYQHGSYALALSNAIGAIAFFVLTRI